MQAKRVYLSATILLAVVAVSLLVVGAILAQEKDTLNDPADASVSQTPDLVIADPQADLPAIIADRLNLAVAPSSVVIPAADFRPDRNIESDYFMSFSGGYLHSNNTSGVYCGIAPLYLPQGVTINVLTGYVYDTYDGDDVWVELLRKKFNSTENSQQLGRATTNGTPGFQAVGDTTILDPVVDNSTYVYYVTSCFGRNTTGSDNRLYGVQVFYTR